MSIKYTKEKLSEVIKNSVSYSDVLRSFGRAPVGGNISHIKRMIFKYGLDIKHFTGSRHNKGKISNKRQTAKDILINSRKRGKRYLLRRSLLEIGRKEECEKCGLNPIWNEKELILIIDHINGDRFDHRPENLRFLCPNCHSQTETFAGRNIARIAEKD